MYQETEKGQIVGTARAIRKFLKKAGFKAVIVKPAQSVPQPAADFLNDLAESDRGEDVNHFAFYLDITTSLGDFGLVILMVEQGFFFLDLTSPDIPAEEIWPGLATDHGWSELTKTGATRFAPLDDESVLRRLKQALAKRRLVGK